MEYYWTTLFNNSNASTSTTSAPGQNRNFTPTHAWDDSWDLPTTSAAAAAAHAADSSRPDFPYYSTTHSMPCTSSSLYRNPDPLHRNPDPHLTCLKLGKRHYFEDLTPPQPPLFTTAKKGKSSPAPPPDSAAVPRCQVEGCEAVLLNAKDYHRRHKVCEMHAKAPKVVVLGIEQRFCQQCSRFHVLGEFDEAKRSCRRRLAGHNERRRKSSQEQNSLARKHYHGGQPQLVNNGECALSLLSPTNSTPDLPARCSAALRELIAENRASLMANSNRMPYNAALLHRGHVTLNLMHGPASAFALHNEDGDGDASHLWNLPFAYSPS